MQRSFLTALVLLGLAVPPLAAQLPKPKPLPSQAAAPTVQLLLVVDDDVQVSIDAKAPGSFSAGRHTVSLPLGRHFIEVRSVRAPEVMAQQTVELKTSGREVVTVSIKARVEEALAGRLPAFEGRVAQPGLTLMLVEPSLAAAVRTHAASVTAAGFDLDVAPQPFNGRLLSDLIRQQVRAEIFETGPPAVAAATIDGFAMQTCAATVGVRWTGAPPLAFAAADSGAAFTTADACDGARYKAVTKALTQLIRTVRKDGR